MVHQSCSKLLGSLLAVCSGYHLLMTAYSYTVSDVKDFFTKSSQHIVSDVLPGVEPMTALSKGQADGMQDDFHFSVAVVKSHKFYTYLYGMNRYPLLFSHNYCD